MGVIIVLCVLAFIAPSTLAYIFARRLHARHGSLLAHARKLAGHRLIAVVLIIAIHVPLVVMAMMMPGNDDSSLPSKYQFHRDENYDAWRHNFISTDGVCILLSLAIIAFGIVLFLRHVVLLVRATRQRASAMKGTPEPNVTSYVASIDFGVGEQRWVSRGEVLGEGYRAAAPIVSHAYGDPNSIWRIWIAPFIDILTFACIFGVLAIDLMLAMGD